MRTAIFIIIFFLWAIAFDTASIDYGVGLEESLIFNLTGWVGFSLLMISGIMLFKDYLKRRE